MDHNKYSNTIKIRNLWHVFENTLDVASAFGVGSYAHLDSLNFMLKKILLLRDIGIVKTDAALSDINGDVYGEENKKELLRLAERVKNAFARLVI